MSAWRTASTLDGPLGREGNREGLMERAEVRDVLAWLRLLVNPRDASAVVRALARPPIELRQVHLARVIALARRRKLDLVAGLTAAIESPQVPPEARERIHRFLKLHRRAAADLDTLGPEVYLAGLIEMLNARGRALLAPEHAAEQRASLVRLRELAARFVRRSPAATPRELAAHLTAAGARRARTRGAAPEPAREQLPESAREQVEQAAGASPARERPPVPAGAKASQSSGEESHQAADEQRLHETLRVLRAEVLESVSRTSGRLADLRLDSELDIGHAVVRYLELLKVAALLQRHEGQALADALADISSRLLAAATPLQREILQTSSLDDALLTGAAWGADATEEHSLGPFLPRRGVGVALSASDIATYRSCPLRYKYSRVLRIPTEQTLGQRFGIAVHQVLERFHGEGGETLEQMLALLDAGWLRAGLGDAAHERELYEKARAALTRYHERLREQHSEPLWFERAFAFRVGPHHLRGRVDRVDRIARAHAAAESASASGELSGAQAEYELIDYKTSHPKSAAELEDDIQLSLYALAAREDWRLGPSRQAYYYVLDDRKVPVGRDERDTEAVKDVVLEVGEGILAEDFRPTPSPAACSICAYRIVCPAAAA